MNNFRGYLGLEKKKEKVKYKKRCIDLGQGSNEKQGNQDIRCNAANMGRVVNLKQKQFQGILGKIKSIDDFWSLVKG